MRMTVNTMQTEFVFGNVRELRGNFITRTRETDNGPVIEYECDYFRTTGGETFEVLYARQRIPELKEFLSSTDWIHLKCAEEGLDVNTKYPEIVQQRIDARNEINTLEALLA